MLRRWRWVAGLIVTFGLILAMTGGTVLVASATQGDDHKTTICHRTGSVTNPYVTITVDNGSIDGDLANDHGQGDHYAEHTGPIAPATGQDGKWGDVIPPLAGVHDGLNWTAEGQAAYANDCKLTPDPTPIPTPTPTAVPTPTPTTTPTPIPTPTPTPTPTTTPTPGTTPSATPETSSSPTATPTGAVLAATGSTTPGQGVGILLIAFGLIVMTGGALVWRRREA